MKILAVFFLSLLFVAVLGACAEEPRHAPDRDPIDAAMAEAMEKNPSTAGMVSAIAAAQFKWQEKIAVTLKKLREQMEGDEWEALELSQRAWTVFRDNETKALHAIYSRMQGTMWRPVAAKSVMNLYRSRAIELRGYLQTLAER